MKILILGNNLKSSSGWGRLSSSIVNELQKNNHEVLALTESSEAAIACEKNLLKPANSFFNILKNIFIVRSAAKDFEIIHALDGFPYSIYGYFAALFNKKKLFITGVGTYSVAPLQNKLKAPLLKLAYKKAKAIFCISNYTKNKILEKVNCNCVTVFMGAPEIKTQNFDLAALKAKYKITDNYPIFLTVGAINPRKGQLDSLQAVAKLSAEYPKFKYFIIGDDSAFKDYAAEIKKYIADNNLDNNVYLLNNIKGDSKLAFFYRVCDYFIMTSVNFKNTHFEGFGLVFLEAYQFGKPAIGSTDCGIEDAIVNGKTGFLTKQSDINDIYEKIKLLFKSDKVKMRQNCLDFVKQFSWEKTIAEYLKYYKS